MLHRDEFRSNGFVVLRHAFEPAPLLAEIADSMNQKFRAPFHAQVGAGELSGRYVPMMCERTPISLSLLDRFARPAAELLGAPVLPVRAKSVLYFGETDWHRDSAHDLASVGFAAYLEPLRAGTGALQVIPGSHRGEPAKKEGVPVETDPGDVIVFDEHLLHASAGGRNRLQWRVDYVADPVGPAAEARTRAYYAGIYRPDWDGGYDVDAYPSYGKHWMESGRPWVLRLAELGVYDAASAEETFARSRSTSG